MEIAQQIELLKNLELNKVEQDLLDINIKLMNIPDRQHLSLEFIRKEGQEGITRLLSNVNFRMGLTNLFHNRVKVIGGAITINRF